MPIVWNAENESKLLAGLFKVCDIKVSGQQLKELAEMMGSDCTPKAVTHRIAKFKKAAAAFNSGSKKGGRASPSEEAEGLEDAGEDGKKKGAKGGKRGRKRQAEEAAGDVGEDEDEEQAMKKVKAEEDGDDEFV